MGGFRRTHSHGDGGDDRRGRVTSRAVLALCTHAHVGMGGYACDGSGVRAVTSWAGEGRKWGVGRWRAVPARAIPDVAGCADVSFVRQWSELLDELEQFERSLESKSTISADNLEAMSQMRFTEAPLFVLAVAEAQLSSPPQFSSGGESTLMRAKDWSTVAPSGKMRGKAIRANELMKSARQFTDAYSHVDAVTRRKHISLLDARLVMMARCPPLRGAKR